MHAELTTDAASFVAAEGRFLVDAAGAVDAEHAGADALRDSQRAADVSGPDGAGEPVLVLVHEANDLLFVLERDDGQYRAEDFLLGDPHPIVGVVEDGGFEEASVRWSAGGGRAAGDQPRAFLVPHIDVALNALALLDRNQRAHLGLLIERIADA